MSKEEQSSSSSQKTPPGSSEASSGYVSPPPYESPVLSREPTPEPVHVIVEPLEMPFDTMPEEAKPRRARKWERIRLVVRLVFVLILVVFPLVTIPLVFSSLSTHKG
ncbi:hypothetical protein FCOIX_6090 [Fusarium coicis]|nr:hypothetical protein FCOIX_6090 [Fusarium coicis]